MCSLSDLIIFGLPYFSIVFIKDFKIEIVDLSFNLCKNNIALEPASIIPNILFLFLCMSVIFVKSIFHILFLESFFGILF